MIEQWNTQIFTQAYINFYINFTKKYNISVKAFSSISDNWADLLYINISEQELYNNGFNIKKFILQNHELVYGEDYTTGKLFTWYVKGY